MKRALAGAVIALCPLVAHAQSAEWTGTVVDKASGKPIAGAYVTQPGSLNGVLTDSEGRFRIKLDPQYGKTLKVSRESYEALQLTASNGQTFSLSPLTGFRNYAPTASFRPDPQAIDSQFHLSYQLNNFDAASGANRVSGLVSNQITAGGQFRLGNWLVKGEGTRNRIPVDVEGFPFKPTVSFDTWQARLGAGYVIPLGTKMLDLYVGPEYLVNFVQPDNRASGDAKPIPFTNTFLDRHPLRHALGANVMLGFRPFAPLTLALDGTYSPLVFSAVEPGMPGLGGLQSWSLGLRADYSIMTGVGVGAGWRHTSWLGDVSDNQDWFTVGLSFNPWQLAK